MKTIYIPWFWNTTKDKIQENYFEWEVDVIQANIKGITSKRINSFTEWKNFYQILSDLKKHYPDTDKKTLLWVMKKWNNFKWFTRDISTTTFLTNQAILEIINPWDTLKLVWHSQGWLIAMKAILENPELLKYLEEIDLLAPVVNLQTWWDFHKWKESWYLNGKWVIVRPEYISELEWDKNMLYNLFELLKKSHWKGTLKLVIWKSDKVIPIQKFNVDEIKKLYPQVKINIVEWDHYLGYKS